MQLRSMAAGLAVLTALVSTPSLAGEDGIAVSAPFARETPPNARVGGVYMTLTNHGPVTRLIGVRSDAAKKAEIHTHSMDAAGVMRMHEVEDGVPLGQGETVAFAPGGFHIMLMGLVAPLRRGAVVPLTLEFADGSTVEVAAPVESIAARGPMTHDHGSKAHDH